MKEEKYQTKMTDIVLIEDEVKTLSGGAVKKLKN